MSEFFTPDLFTETERKTYDSIKDIYEKKQQALEA